MENKRNDLPEYCYHYDRYLNQVIIVKNGEHGYWKYKHDSTLKTQQAKIEFVNSMNEVLNISKQEESALAWGSMFGFDTKGANPKNYDDTGKLIKRG